ncbi:hypothetical protein S7711_00199 [Stachybotrys chartarum IBT 7711]|uniref:Uncharacterized protein n=1 Tax=Stachybotrys chartarum (strain CBS 109288 / IBT 7711) TaxID=1280523 RepID=A0A084B3R6_STACB|nr:hypothetical protein S7711_00199 [Stachybotrys chartarum IBT 7711]KFA52138.1 hypothetical protein S40293_00596 [Stachybotrys chartarum IBT 40293]
MPPASSAAPIPSSTLSSSFNFSTSASTLSRPTTREGDYQPRHQQQASGGAGGGGSNNTNSGSSFFRDRKPSFSRKASFSGAIARRRGSSNTSASAPPDAFVTDAAAPPALPDFALAAAARIVPLPPSATSDTQQQQQQQQSPEAPRFKMMGRTPAAYAPLDNSAWAYETNMLHQHVTEVANKRMSTLNYLRKAHEGRVYWFNTYLFDKPDLNRMPSFDPRKLARKATNYLLLGLSLPTISDLYSSTPLEFLRSLNALLSEFDSFQQLHSDSSASLARARLPSVFRRPANKSRRSTSASEVSNDDFPASSSANSIGGATPSVMSFAASESDLLPGEEYTYLLTPSLPFEPDFFETFATLCDTLIDTYARFLQLVPTPRECSAPVAELFGKADARVRRILVQGVVKDFEDHSRSHVKAEVASIGKVVLGGLL